MKDIFSSIDTGKIQEAIELIKDKNFNPDIKDSRGLSPLYYAAEKGHFYTVKSLLNKGANQNLKDKSNCSALYYASSRG